MQLNNIYLLSRNIQAQKYFCWMVGGCIIEKLSQPTWVKTELSKAINCQIRDTFLHPTFLNIYYYLLYLTEILPHIPHNSFQWILVKDIFLTETRNLSGPLLRIRYFQHNSHVQCFYQLKLTQSGNSRITQWSNVITTNKQSLIC